MFQGLVGIYIDKQNRVFTSEIFPGRVQQFRYVTDAEAERLRKEKEAARGKKTSSSVPVPVPAIQAKAANSK